MRKKRKSRRWTAEELLGREFVERHERTQRLLKERIEYHERKLAEAQGGSSRRI